MFYRPAASRPYRSAVDPEVPIGLKRVVLRSAVQSRMQPVHSESGGAEPGWLCADVLLHRRADRLPEGLLPSLGGASYEAGDVGVTWCVRSGAGRDQPRVATEARERNDRSVRCCRTKIFAKSQRVCSGAGQFRAVDQDELKSATKGRIRDGRCFPEKSGERCVS